MHIASTSHLTRLHAAARARPLRVARQNVQCQAKGFGFASLKQQTKRTAKDGRELLQPGKLSPMRPVPEHIPRPPYAVSGKLPAMNHTPEVHDAQGIEKMRAACHLAARVLEYAGSLVRPGITTDAIDAAVHRMIVDAGAYPSPLNYGRFPKSLCTSVNECLCHGIPDDRPLCEGDIVNLDVTVYLDGYHGDTSRTFFVGAVSDTARRLCEATEQALHEGIRICGPGVPVRNIGEVVEAVATAAKFNVCKEFIGHGVGRAFHAGPCVLHHRNNERGTLQVGQTFTIEPILVAGSPRSRTWKDNWTAVTTDGSLSAQAEHTILITPNGAEVLTRC